MAAQAKSVTPIATTAIGDGGWQAQSIALTATTAIGDGGLQAKRVALKAGTAMLFCQRTIDNKVSNNSYSGVMAQGNLKNPLFSVIDNIGKIFLIDVIMIYFLIPYLFSIWGWVSAKRDTAQFLYLIIINHITQQLYFKKYVFFLFSVFYLTPITLMIICEYRIATTIPHSDL